jgi:hypothetical protein
MSPTFRAGFLEGSAMSVQLNYTHVSCKDQQLPWKVFAKQSDVIDLQSSASLDVPQSRLPIRTMRNSNAARSQTQRALKSNPC